ncbi:formate dehydrogenase accessory sulfurtransferase FdhD [Tropicimonas sediminicola]|nr:formate dehydrogenase accessory sulfurtransferase FdhD [Tropicimonas sediminicola]
MPIPVTGQAGRLLVEEVPVALVYNGSTHAVMMATPADLEDFAAGFSISEGIVERVGDLGEIEIVPQGEGVELRMWLEEPFAARLANHRRAMAGPVGCGLCGIDSIEAALRPPAPVLTRGLELTSADLREAPAALRRAQPLHDATGAAHAAGLWRPGQGLVRLREDVGRHNALDKLLGATLKAGETGAGAAVVLTSRVSVEMVQKAAALGAEAILAVSAPTTLAVRMAQDAGLTLITNLKGGEGRVLAHPTRLKELSSR